MKEKRQTGCCCIRKRLEGRREEWERGKRGTTIIECNSRVILLLFSSASQETVNACRPHGISHLSSFCFCGITKFHASSFRLVVNLFSPPTFPHASSITITHSL